MYMPKANANEDALWSEAGSVSFPYFKFETPGDRVMGTYVGQFESVSSKYGYPQRNYVLVKADGSKIVVSGRNPVSKTDPLRIIYGMEKIPLGAVMGFIYTGDKDTGKGNPAKLVEPKYLGERNEEVLKKFQAMFTLDQVKEAATSETGPVEPASEEPTY
jgi:hypothetical protein